MAISKDQLEQIKELKKKKWPHSAIASHMGLDHTTVYNALHNKKTTIVQTMSTRQRQALLSKL